MELKDILAVGLTPEDFDLLIKGIDAIPEKDAHEETLRDIHAVMLATLVSKTQADIQLKKMEARKKDISLKLDAKKEDLVILKSKMILLKRLLLSNEALKTVNEILTPLHKIY